MTVCETCVRKKERGREGERERVTSFLRPINQDGYITERGGEGGGGGSRAFSVCSHSTWNGLPLPVRHKSSLDLKPFKSNLKTFLFPKL